jgi:hypothetical protein
MKTLYTNRSIISDTPWVDDAAMIFHITGHKLLEIQAESAHIQTAHFAGED